MEIRETMMKELRDAFFSIRQEDIDRLMGRILKADKIFVYACGRELLMLKAFAMRLHHLGFRVHVVGDVTVPLIGPSDLMIAVCGPGNVATDIALARIAKNAGAEVVGITATKDGEFSQCCTDLIVADAQTMSVKAGEAKSIQPMGAVFEQALLMMEEYLVVRLADVLKLSESDMRSRHTILE